MKAYTLGRRNKVSTNGMPRELRKQVSKLKVKSRRDRRKSDRKQLRDEYEF